MLPSVPVLVAPLKLLEDMWVVLQWMVLFSRRTALLSPYTSLQTSLPREGGLCTGSPIATVFSSPLQCDKQPYGRFKKQGPLEATVF